MQKEIDKTEELRLKLKESFNLLVKQIGVVQIGNVKQFPFGWRKAAKGRTVWRILEELITQNLENDYSKFGFEYIRLSDSEVSVYDFECKFKDIDEPIFVNIKSAVKGGKKNKDDLSKAQGLVNFYDEDADRNIFIGSFVIDFKDDMTIEISDSIPFPLAWIPDIYVNPSNNGNLQSSEYKDITKAEKRDNKTFINALKAEIEVADEKKRRKQGRG